MKTLEFIIMLAWSFYVVWAVSGDTIKLSWPPNPETNINRYLVYAGPAPGQYSTITNTPTNSIVLTVTGTNWFIVTAVNDWGLESGFFNETCWPPAYWLTNAVWWSATLEGTRYLLCSEAIAMQPGFYHQTLSYGVHCPEDTNSYAHTGWNWWLPQPPTPTQP